MLALDEKCRFGEYLIHPDTKRVILNGAATEVSARVMDVMMYLIVHHDRVVSADELLAQFWAGRVVEESTIHRIISQIRTALGDSARDPQYVKTVSKRGYQAIAPVVASSEPASAQGWSRWLPALLVAGVLLVVATIYIASDSRGTEDASPTIQPSLASLGTLAVLPFTNLSNQTDLGYFAQGLADEVLDDLARSEKLGIASRTESFELVSKGMGLKEMAERMQVAYVVEGSVQASGGDIRIIAQLIRARDGFHVWSQTYEHPIAEGFDLQEVTGHNIAHNVATRVLFDVQRQHPELFDEYRGVLPEALDFYLQAEEVFLEVSTGGTGTLLYALQLSEKAVAIDPNFAQAHWDIAWAHMRRVDPSIPLPEVLTVAHAHLNDFRRLRPQDPSGLFLLAQVLTALDLNYAGAEAATLEGIRQAPDWIWWRTFLAGIAMREGRLEDALHYLKIDAGLDFESEAPIFLWIYADVLRLSGEYQASLRASGEALDMLREGRARIDLLLVRVHTLLDMEQDEAAQAILDQAWSEADGKQPEAFVQAYARLGDVERAQQLLAESVPELGNRGDIIDGAIALQNYDLALELISDGIQDHDRSVLDGLRVNPEWEPIRSDERFLRLLTVLEAKEKPTAAYSPIR